MRWFRYMTFVLLVTAFCIPFTMQAAGYVDPSDYFEITTETAAATIDGTRDTAAGTYSTSATESGTYLHIWAYHYSNDIYMYIEVLNDDTLEAFDTINLYFEKDHDNVLEVHDEAISVIVQSVGPTTFQQFYGNHTGSDWEWYGTPTFDFARMADDQGSRISWEFRLDVFDCGFESNDDFGFLIETKDANTNFEHWPDATGTIDVGNISLYGEVASSPFPEFPAKNLVFFVLPLMSAIVLKVGYTQLRRK